MGERDFGWAIRCLKKGELVRRAGWNGKGMHIHLKDFGGDVEPCVVMFTAQQKYQPGWVASQADMLATDWERVN